MVSAIRGRRASPGRIVGPMLRPVALGTNTYLRKPHHRDADEFVERVVTSRDHLEPFVYGPTTESGFRTWLARGERADSEQFLIARRSDNAIAGFVNLNNIVRGSLQSAAAGWAAFLPYAGAGHMTEGLELVLEVAFTQLGLHRVEANIQPANARSRMLAVRCGFRLEGFSPRFLKVGDHWRDHERWAIIVDDWRSTHR